ncbi:hypothetical protein [Rhizobium sp. PP-CC-3G-465]|uniref:hypothetical protein n=1 Tax=Rhizobium sp. PP-CC-3G-465 TaxID=2135648 RepID=UPI00104E6F82
MAERSPLDGFPDEQKRKLKNPFMQGRDFEGQAIHLRHSGLDPESRDLTSVRSKNPLSAQGLGLTGSRVKPGMTEVERPQGFVLAERSPLDGFPDEQKRKLKNPFMQGRDFEG